MHLRLPKFWKKPKAKLQHAHDVPQLLLPQDPIMILSSPLFALIIGIDKYEYYPPLRGAVKDANKMEDFLKYSLGIPPENIIKLVDGQATKAAIMQTLESFRTNRNIRDGDAILIYFAGHGGRAETPRDWNPGNTDRKIEMICPVNMTLSSAQENRVSGIPDLFIGALVTNLAREKSDNIVLIFDCCHSANANRDEKTNYDVRGIDVGPAFIPEDLRDPSVRGTAAYLRSFECSVLLSACGRDEQAGEDSSGGFFTQRLLEELRGLIQIPDGLRGVTYNELNRRIKISERQNPQCEGIESHRFLFRRDTANQGFIRGYRDKTGELVLDAGSLLGIRAGANYEIYRKNILSPANMSLGQLGVSRVDLQKSYLTQAPNSAKISVPNDFYAILAGFGEEQKITVYSCDTDQLNNLISQHETQFYGFVKLVGSDADAALLVFFSDENRTVSFQWHPDNPISRFAGSPAIGCPLPVSDKSRILQVFQAAAKFHYYSNLQGNQSVDTTSVVFLLQELEMTERDVYGYPTAIGTPVGPNVVANEPAYVHVTKGVPFGPLGLTLLNNTSRGLYPHVFWFSGQSLTIGPIIPSHPPAGEWYSSSDATIPPLPARKTDISGRLPVGYGEGTVGPWGFTVQGEHPDVGFFLLVTATMSSDFSSLPQQSPFSESYNLTRKVRFVCEHGPWWIIRKFTVVQVPTITARSDDA